jgi:hypothetical protein
MQRTDTLIDVLAELKHNFKRKRHCFFIQVGEF